MIFKITVVEKKYIRVLLLCSGKRVQLVEGAAKFLPAYSVLVPSEVKKKASEIMLSL